MKKDRNLEQLEKRLLALTEEERAQNGALRVLREERRHEMERLDRLFNAKEIHIENEIKHILHEIPNLERDIKRRQEELEDEFEHQVKK